MIAELDFGRLLTRVREWLTPRSDGTPDYWISLGVLVALTVVAAVFAHRVGRWLLVGMGRRFVTKTKTPWDDFLVTRGVFSRLAHALPAAVLLLAAQYVYADIPRGGFAVFLSRLGYAYLTGVGVGVAFAILDVVKDVYHSFETAHRNPIAGFVGGAKILVFIVGSILLISAILGLDPWGLVVGIGALMAVLLLIFKDAILGLVASIQILANDLVDLGDWIEIPAYGADGTVTDISLTTLKVENFDKTIVSVPTYALISGAFRNWRGMTQAGGRRVKRSVRLDMSSIRFCDEETLDGFERIELIRDYVKERRAQIAKVNREHGHDPEEVANGRRMTNVGTFRAYLRAFIQEHPKVRDDMTRIVRQLPPGSDGLPIELYLFSAETAWADYEDLQSDLFDHVLAVLPRFGLRVFQHPSGADLASLENLAAARASA